MKKLILIIIAALVCGASLTSCVDTQKPSKRHPVWTEDSVADNSATLSSNKVLVPFTRTSGNLAEVQVSLNGVPFNMWWDTGASITSISALELQKLAKEGKISLSDYEQSIVTQIADGSTVENLVFNIKEIYIPAKDNQYLILHDISATVSENAGAPLLIGQNVIQNLPKHSFNEEEGVIEFDKQ